MSYASVAENGTKVKDRIKWLKGMTQPNIPQVYRQLSSVYQSQGDERNAKKVLVAGQDAQYSSARFWPIKVFGWVFKWTVGYGYWPSLILLWLAVLELFGAFLFTHLQGDMLLAPIYINSTGDHSGSHHALGTITPTGPTEHGYPAFQPWLYTLDLLLPLVKLRQSDIWIPHRAAEWWSMVFITSGWALATALVIGLGSVFARGRQDSPASP
jgi:hypothetical protein